MKDEALKLASALDHWATQMDMGRKPDPKSLIRKASAELRRLQAELDAVKQARALDKMAENARELGLDYEPADGTQVSKVWWDGEKLMAKPIPLEDIYQSVQDSTCNETLRSQDKAYPRTCKKCGKGPCIGAPKQPPAAQPAPVQEPWKYRRWNDEAEKWELTDDCGWPSEPVYTTPPAAPVMTDEKGRPLKFWGGKSVEPIAQPAVPDAIHHTDLSEHPQYIEGWNDCREEMLKGMKP
jgi:hypothetical protein